MLVQQVHTSSPRFHRCSYISKVKGVTFVILNKTSFLVAHEDRVLELSLLSEEVRLHGWLTTKMRPEPRYLLDGRCHHCFPSRRQVGALGAIEPCHSLSHSASHWIQLLAGMSTSYVWMREGSLCWSESYSAGRASGWPSYRFIGSYQSWAE